MAVISRDRFRLLITVFVYEQFELKLLNFHIVFFELNCSSVLAFYFIYSFLEKFVEVFYFFLAELSL